MTDMNGIDSQILARIPQTARIILEVGAVGADLAHLVRRTIPSASYWTTCTSEDMARSLEPVDKVLRGATGDSDIIAALDQALAGQPLDVVITRDPALLDDCHRDLASRANPATTWLTVLPNAGSASNLRRALLGDPMAPGSATQARAAEVIMAAGMVVSDVVGLEEDGDGDAITTLLPAALKLGAEAVSTEKRLQSGHWLVKSSLQAQAESLTVVALALRKMAGVTEARVDYPLQALASLPGVTAAWGAGSVVVPAGAKPGIFMLHRQFLHEEPLISTVEAMIAKGWTIVSEIDDDPHHWKEYVKSDFRAFRGVHAVTVSTPAMAELVRQWNPEVEIFPNHMAALPNIPALTPKNAGKLRVFFGALNRGDDWPVIVDTISAAALTHASQLEMVIVHDKAFFDALPAGASKTFHPTLSHSDYMTVLASCDLALLPLSDTPFNRLKSDLKLVECAGAGVVPICSRTVYGEEPEHESFAVFPNRPTEWASSLIDLLASPAELRRRRDIGLDYVRRRRTHSGDVARRKAYYLDLIARRDQLERERAARLSTLQPG